MSGMGIVWAILLNFVTLMLELLPRLNHIPSVYGNPIVGDELRFRFSMSPPEYLDGSLLLTLGQFRTSTAGSRRSGGGRNKDSRCDFSRDSKIATEIGVQRSSLRNLPRLGCASRASSAWSLRKWSSAVTTRSSSNRSN